ncbi:MAG TPA: hypothetical protein VLT59_07965, partial [Steroidobacteraceae bacterium]|nr:hypothetical protein [Steroidobacteraceae bacterium]
ESLARAETLYRDAIAQDPGYAAAHSGLGRTLSFANAALAGDDPEQLDRIVLPHLARALELDPGLAEPYMVMGNLRRWSLRAGGDDFYRLASQLEPSNAMAHENLAALAHSQNRPDQMLEHALRARELDPLAFGTHQKVISALVVLGRLQELDAAVARMNATLAGNPTAITLTCNVHLLSGDPPRAIACADEALRELGEEPGLIGILAESHARLGLVDEEQRFSDRLADEGDPRAALWGLVDRDDRTALRDTLDAALAGPVAFHEGIELARAAAAGGFPERALQIYEVAGVLEATRNDAVVRASGMESLPEIVLLLRQAGRAAEAQPLVERLLEWSARPLEHGARHADTIAFHGVALAVAGRLDQAFARLNQAVDAFGSPFDARVLTEGPVGALLGADPRLEHVFAALQNRQAALRAALPMPPR